MSGVDPSTVEVIHNYLLSAAREMNRNLVRTSYTTIVYVLFPNTVLVVQQAQVETWRIYPDGNDPNLAKMHVSLYTPEPVLTERAERHWANNMNLLIRVVDQEDFPLGERMQGGFHSAAQRHISFGRNEPALGHFHRRLDEVVLATA